MARRFALAIPLLAAFCLLAFAPARAEAAARKALFVTISGPYNVNGDYAYSELKLYAESLHGAGVTEFVLLGTDGEVAALLAANSYEQIWIYDLSDGTDSYPTDITAIAAWYSQAPIKEIICDGRFLGSFYQGRQTTEGRKLTENYFKNLDIRGGGIILATDHNVYADGFTNPLAAALGLGPFSGNFGGSFPLDQGHPLTSDPNVLTSLANDTTTGQAPFGERL